VRRAQWAPVQPRLIHTAIPEVRQAQ